MLYFAHILYMIPDVNEKNLKLSWFGLLIKGQPMKLQTLSWQ